MFKGRKNERSVVMLTTDRQIDRRIILTADSLEASGWVVSIIAMPLDRKLRDDCRVVRIGAHSSQTKWENIILDGYRWLRNHIAMNGSLMRMVKSLVWNHFINQELFYEKLFFDTVVLYSPAIIVANDLPMLPVASKVAIRCAARLVYDSHELYSEQEFSEREKRKWSAIEAKLIDKCDVVITVNQSIATELERRYGIKDVKVISNAERSSHPPNKKQIFHKIFGLDAMAKVLLYQGGILMGRNLEILLEAMRHVQNSLVVLVLLGDGVLTRKLRVKSKTYNLAHKVYFHEAVSQEDLITFTIAADAGIIPYQATCLNNYFCTPNKLFEFIAAGIPILASDLPEIRNIVERQHVGMVGDMSTPKRLASLIDEFFEDEQSLISWRSNLVEVRKHLCWEEEGKKIVEIYEELR